MVLSSTQVKLGARLAITPKLLLTSSELGPRKQISMTFTVMHLFREIPFKNRYIIIENIVCKLWAILYKPWCVNMVLSIHIKLSMIIICKCNVSLSPSKLEMWFWFLASFRQVKYTCMANCLSHYDSPVSQCFSPSAEQPEQRKLAYTL